MSRFETIFRAGSFNLDVVVRTDSRTSCWNADDVSGEDAEDLLDDLSDDVRANCFDLVDSQNEVVIGWVDKANHNGIAFIGANGGSKPFALAAETCVAPGFWKACLDWSHKAIAAHEIAHIFSGAHHRKRTDPYAGCWATEGDYVCDSIMHYPYAYAHGGGSFPFDSDNRQIVGNNLCGCTSFGSKTRWSDHP